MAMPVRSLLERYELTDEESNKKVSDNHLEELSRTRCIKWRRLPTYLNMDPTVAKDIDHKPIDEDEKRHNFFTEWKERKGSDATCNTLIAGLLKIGCKEDAEYVCELLKSEHKLASDLSSADAAAKEGTTATIESTVTTAASAEKNLSPTPEASGDIESAEQDLGQKEKHVSIEDLDPDTREELIIQLESKRDEIKKKYAAFVESLYKAIEAKSLTLKLFQLYLLSIPAYESRQVGEQPILLDDVKAQIKAAESIIDIFQILVTECCSFMNIGIFEYIIERYNINTSSHDLQYPQHLKEYLKSHKISEFIAINPKLNEVEDKEKMILKFDVTLPNYITKVFNLKRAIAKILKVKPCTLRLVSIEEGCVVVTFLLTPAVAKCLFASGLTPAQETDIRALSVLWLKCGTYTLDEVLHSSENTPSMPPAVLRTPSTALELKLEPQVQETPSLTSPKEEIDIILTGDWMSGKNLLRNLFGAEELTSHFQKRLEKNEVIINISDSLSLSLEPTCDLLIYCINVAHPEHLQVQSRNMEWLQEIYGKKIWENCVIVFTFSTMLLAKTIRKTDDIKTKYIAELEKCLGEFRRILKKLQVNCAVKTIFETNHGNPPEGIIGIPAGLEKDDPVLLEQKDGWIDQLFIQMLYKCKRKKQLAQHCYGENVPITIARIVENEVAASKVRFMFDGRSAKFESSPNSH